MANIFKNAKFGNIFITKDGTKNSFCSFTVCGGEPLARLYREKWGVVLFYLDGRVHSGCEFGSNIDFTIVDRCPDDNGWIPVTEDTMPQGYRFDDEKRSERLLFMTKDEQIHIGVYSYYPIGEWCCEDASLDIPCSSGEVTHWQPLPGKKVFFEE